MDSAYARQICPKWSHWERTVLLLESLFAFKTSNLKRTSHECPFNERIVICYVGAWWNLLNISGITPYKIFFQI